WKCPLPAIQTANENAFYRMRYFFASDHGKMRCLENHHALRHLSPLGSEIFPNISSSHLTWLTGWKG
ncbi:hypothetical protein, partial [Methanomethylovorans sp.]|uniref:hypothetical protein n=1 Tax=Methanomethylovorans sp. TaxID=2758717 RepID=UPI00351C15D6